MLKNNFVLQNNTSLSYFQRKRKTFFMVIFEISMSYFLKKRNQKNFKLKTVKLRMASNAGQNSNDTEELDRRRIQFVNLNVRD